MTGRMNFCSVVITMQFHFQIGNLIKWNLSQGVLIASTCPLASCVKQLGSEYSLTQE